MIGNPYFFGQTLDDVMRSAIEAILARGEKVRSSKGPNKELTGVILEVADPRARLSRTETRGKPFSCLGELCWYLAGNNQLEFIYYYIPMYSRFAEEGLIPGGYGPRLFGGDGENQVAKVIRLLTEKQETRRAVIQLFDSEDIAEKHEDVPCTCALQFMIRGGKLQMITYMRSNDAYLGLPHDVFCFTMLQEMISRSLSVELGSYKHVAGSLHLYDDNRNAVKQFLGEGWQPTETLMPVMPVGAPWPSIESVLEAESAIRNGNPHNVGRLDGLDPYWADLIRLLQVYRYSTDGDTDKIMGVRERMSSNVYNTFIDKKRV